MQLFLSDASEWNSAVCPCIDQIYYTVQRAAVKRAMNTFLIDSVILLFKSSKIKNCWCFHQQQLNTTAALSCAPAPVFLLSISIWGGLIRDHGLINCLDCAHMRSTPRCSDQNASTVNTSWHDRMDRAVLSEC